MFVNLLKKYPSKIIENAISKQNKNYKFNFSKINFYVNPHCSENNTLGSEDKVIKDTLSSFKKIRGPFAADSAFENLKKTLFLSMYHDQTLIPFKILNKMVLT